MSEKNAREIALATLDRIEYQGAYANLAVNQAIQGAVNQLDRAFVTELVYGTVRRRLTLQWVLEQHINRPWRKVDKEIRLILLLGAYQLLYMDKVPASAACNEMVKITKTISHRGAAGLVNGVLRNIVRQQGPLNWPESAQDPVGYLSVRYSHPRWLVELWLSRFGFVDTESLCQINNTPSPVTARVNSLKTNKHDLAQKLVAEGVSVATGKLMPQALAVKSGPPVDRLDSFQQGLFIFQDEASMLPVKVLDPRPGSFAIDGCAAPGSKTTQMAEQMKNSGTVVACDVHKHKLKLIRQNAQRLGCDIIREQLLDARSLAERYPAQADFLLLDVPCSGLGVLSRRADARWRKKPADIDNLVELQWQILTGACGAVRPGGVLVYSTCTISRKENEDIIDAFLQQFPHFHGEDITGYLPFELEGKELDDARNGYFQLLPQRHGSDGFFVARLKREE